MKPSALFYGLVSTTAFEDERVGDFTRSTTSRLRETPTLNGVGNARFDGFVLQSCFGDDSVCDVTIGADEPCDLDFTAQAFDFGEFAFIACAEFTEVVADDFLDNAFVELES